MTGKNGLLKERKKERIKISNLDDFKNALKTEGYNINEFDELKFRKKVIDTFKLDNNSMNMLNVCINDTKTTYKADDINDFIDYVKRITIFENNHNKLCESICKIKKMYIDRIEYEREPSLKESVEEILDEIEEIKTRVDKKISIEEKFELIKLEKELDNEYLYAKDIELLKRMILVGNDSLKENYNNQSKVKTISLDIPEKIECEYFKVKKGTVEYHEHLKSNIPRVKRLIKNINKYMRIDEKEKATFHINQSEALQDSINIAIATYDNKEFKAISGKNEISNYCAAPPMEESVFKSLKVNKLGNLGVGYERVNDSEKKILEEIHKQIEKRILKDKGKLILYSKWEPCPSCYFVISQFCKKHPNIKLQVKYIKKYGE